MSEPSIAPHEDEGAPTPALREPEPATLEDIEARLVEIRTLLDRENRAGQYQEYSIAKPVAAITQSIVIGLLAWSLSDVIFSEPLNAIVAKLGFAIVFQLIALTAFVAGRKSA